MAKPFWLLSLLFLLGSCLFVYADLGEPGQLIHIKEYIGEGANIIFSLSRQQFFYFFLLLGIFINAFLLMGSYMVVHLPSQLMPAKKAYWLNNKENSHAFHDRFKLWVKGLAFLINMFLANTAFAVYYMNTKNYFPVNYVYYFLGVLTLIWMIAYLPFFSERKEVD